MKIEKCHSPAKLPFGNTADVYKTSTGLTVFVSTDILYGRPTLHLSASHNHRLPTYEEMKELRYKLCGEARYMGMIFPPQEEFVNVDPNCLHLYELLGIDAVK